MQRVRGIHIEGFRSLRTVDLDDLGPVTVLIGPNGAGKSNLLSFLQMVPRMVTQSLALFVAKSGGASALLHYGPKVTKEIAFEINLEDDDVTRTYLARLGHAAADQLLFLQEQCIKADATGQVAHLLGAGHFESRLKDDANPIVGPVFDSLRRWNLFHFHDTTSDAAIRNYGRAEDSRYLKSYGENLASYIWALKNGDDEARAAWRRIAGWMRIIAPYIKDLVPEGPSGAAPGVLLTWIDEKDELFGPHHLSDGTIRALALLVALGQPRSKLPRFITIDEPELGLHPLALSLFCDVVRSVSDHCQIVLATQSPALLDHFEPSEVRVVERNHGETSIRRLDPDRLTEWLDEFSLSELYDKNVLGGRP